MEKRTLGERFKEALALKEKRDQREWTHQDIANAIGRPKSRAFISTIANMKRVPKTLNLNEIWRPLENLLEVNLWWLLYEEGERDKEKGKEVSKAKSELYNKLVGVSDEEAQAVSHLIDAFLAGKKGPNGNPQ